ncbi:SDR family NAD(P)-dependent oxidoreductase [Paenibacillus periandrae]|uniref:SDR family NAD(P)-dependent oxidoreductase n=1 Tax=Paenibacillus periandrae TaxID=1761741 RepID=UPI001F08CFFB|nr:SDR family NAD(P)-dependent oxidoreductase [Paenibacillus periandrae]
MKKTAFVTGANKGIGIEIVKQLSEAGWKVVLGARSAERGEAAVSELTSKGLDVEFVQIDISDLKTIEQAADTLNKNYPDLKLLINNAGMPGAFSRSFTDTKEEEDKSFWRTRFQVK